VYDGIQYRSGISIYFSLVPEKMLNNNDVPTKSSFLSCTVKLVWGEEWVKVISFLCKSNSYDKIAINKLKRGIKNLCSPGEIFVSAIRWV